MGIEQVENKKTTTKNVLMLTETNNEGNEHDTSGLLQRSVYKNKRKKKPQKKWELNKYRIKRQQ